MQLNCFLISKIVQLICEPSRIRHSGRDRLNSEHREVNLVCPPWLLDSGNPCRNDGVLGLAETSS